MSKLPKHMLRLAAMTAIILAISGMTTGLSGVVASSKHHAVTYSQSAEAPQELRQFAQGIISQLSQQETFSSWNKAALVIEPLGPGTHAWLVSLKPPAGEKGYLIIGAKPSGGYALLEYGQGLEPLYSSTSLDRALASLIRKNPGARLHYQAEKFYGGPATTEWRILTTQQRDPVTHYDALSGELLPPSESDGDRLTFENWKQDFTLVTGSAYPMNSSPKLTLGAVQITAPAFSTFDNILWIAREAERVDTSSFPQLLEQHHKLVFASRGAGRAYSSSLPINGYQTWEDSLSSKNPSVYVMSRSTTITRWISLDLLLRTGKFYTLGQQDHSM